MLAVIIIQHSIAVVYLLCTCAVYRNWPEDERRIFSLGTW